MHNLEVCQALRYVMYLVPMLSTAGKVVIVEGGVSETNEGGWVIQGLKEYLLIVMR